MSWIISPTCFSSTAALSRKCRYRTLIRRAFLAGASLRWLLVKCFSTATTTASNTSRFGGGGPSGLSAAFRLQQGTADEAVALVNKAVALHKTTSRDQFLRSTTDKTQPYHDRDMYVFVLDAGGTYLAFGGNQAKVGTRVQDIPGVAGDRLVSDIVTQADRAPGWVEYDITNPATGAVQTKMSYVSRVGDWYVGCGVYKSLAAR